MPLTFLTSNFSTRCLELFNSAFKPINCDSSSEFSFFNFESSSMVPLEKLKNKKKYFHRNWVSPPPYFKFSSNCSFFFRYSSLTPPPSPLFIIFFNEVVVFELWLFTGSELLLNGFWDEQKCFDSVLSKVIF